MIWGRNDEGGREWAEAMAECVGIPAHVVSLSNAPPHWHLADGLPPGRTLAQLHVFLASAAGTAAPRTPKNPVPGTTPPPADVTKEFIRSSKGAIEKVFSNVVCLLRQQPDAWNLTYDEFSRRPFLDNEPMEDTDMRRIAEWVQHNGVTCGFSTIQEGIMRMSERRPFHPVKQYLESLKWDGKNRLSNMLTVLGGAVPDADGLSNLLGRKWMIQAVARIYEPGCQADAMLVLEGEQGLGKSSLFRALFGDRWFTDHLPDLGDKDAMLQLRGVWCVEISELATLGRSDSAKIKQFLTSRVDRYRDPYGRLVSDWPRTSVFAGTINPGAEGYLKDPTGGRRFWPIPIRNTINLPGIAENRDQLWAEALTAYTNGEQWHLTDEELARRGQVEARQAARLEEDPWEPEIATYLAQKEHVTMADILRDAIRLSSTADWGRVEQSRVGRVLTALGWTRRRTRTADGFRWVYCRTEKAEGGQQTAMDLDERPDVA